MTRPLKKRRIALCIGALAASFGAWYLPATAEDPLVGRYSPGSLFVGVIVSLFAGICLLFVCAVRARKTRFRVSALLMAFCVSWGAAEFVAYGVDWGRPNPFYNHRNPSVTDPDAMVRYRRPPHLYWKGIAAGDLGPGDPFVEEVVFQTDADGFRNSKESQTADIVFIGDSFTEAGNVREEQTFVSQTGTMLELTATNLGTAGYGPLEEVSVLENFALKKQPRWIVWQLCEGNDLSDVVNFLYWQQLGGQGTDTLTSDEIWTRRYSRWQRTSPFVRLVKLSCGRGEEYRIAAEGEFTLQDKSTTTIRFQVLPSEHTDPEYNSIRWEKTREALHLGQALCLNANTRLLVIVIPIKLRVFQESVSFKDFPSHVANLKEQSKLSQFVQDACESAGIEFLDPTTTFREFAKNGEAVYFPFDTHLSPIGHRKLAELIAARIEKN